jgi:hypothetical protein
MSEKDELYSKIFTFLYDNNPAHDVQYARRLICEMLGCGYIASITPDSERSHISNEELRSLLMLDMTPPIPDTLFAHGAKYKCHEVPEPELVHLGLRGVFANKGPRSYPIDPKKMMDLITAELPPPMTDSTVLEIRNPHGDFDGDTHLLKKKKKRDNTPVAPSKNWIRIARRKW